MSVRRLAWSLNIAVVLAALALYGCPPRVPDDELIQGTWQTETPTDAVVWETYDFRGNEYVYLYHRADKDGGKAYIPTGHRGTFVMDDTTSPKRIDLTMTASFDGESWGPIIGSPTYLGAYALRRNRLQLYVEMLVNLGRPTQDDLDRRGQLHARSPDEDDAAKIQGPWQTYTPPGAETWNIYAFDGTSYVYVQYGEWGGKTALEVGHRGTFALSDNANPKHIDLTAHSVFDGDAWNVVPPYTAKGVYELNGGQFRAAFGEQPDVRPNALDLVVGGESFYKVAYENDLSALQGYWQTYMQTDSTAWTSLTIRGNQCVYWEHDDNDTLGNNDFAVRGSFSLLSSANPKQLIVEPSFQYILGEWQEVPGTWPDPFAYELNGRHLTLLHTLNGTVTPGELQEQGAALWKQAHQDDGAFLEGTWQTFTAHDEQDWKIWTFRDNRFSYVDHSGAKGFDVGWRGTYTLNPVGNPNRIVLQTNFTFLTGEWTAQDMIQNGVYELNGRHLQLLPGSRPGAEQPFPPYEDLVDDGTSLWKQGLPDPDALIGSWQTPTPIDAEDWTTFTFDGADFTHVRHDVLTDGSPWITGWEGSYSLTLAANPTQMALEITTEYDNASGLWTAAVPAIQYNASYEVGGDYLLFALSAYDGPAPSYEEMTTSGTNFVRTEFDDDQAALQGRWRKEGDGDVWYTLEFDGTTFTKLTHEPNKAITAGKRGPFVLDVTANPKRVDFVHRETHDGSSWSGVSEATFEGVYVLDGDYLKTAVAVRPADPRPVQADLTAETVWYIRQN